jgi:RNA polymerase sigma-70 factor (sigma-E family)
MIHVNPDGSSRVFTGMTAREGVLREQFLAHEVPERGATLTALFDSEYPALRGLAYVLLGDAHVAEEVAMEAFVRAFASWPTVRGLDWPAGYLRRIVINLCRGRMRRQRIESRVNALVTVRRENAVTGWDARQSDARLDVWTAVRSLPDRQRSCVVLRYLEDMSDAEVARVLGCSVGSVKTHMHRARLSLSRILGTQPEEKVR